MNSYDFLNESEAFGTGLKQFSLELWVRGTSQPIDDQGKRCFDWPERPVDQIVYSSHANCYPTENKPEFLKEWKMGIGETNDNDPRRNRESDQVGYFNSPQPFHNQLQTNIKN